MDNISRALKNIVKELDSPEMLQATAPAGWKRGIGDELSRHTAFIELHKKRLTIAVADPMWKKQLEKMSGKLVYLMNRELGENSIHFIEFIIDPDRVDVERAKDRNTGLVDTDYELRSRAEITPELENAAAAINNENLRDLYLGAAANSLLRKKERGNI